MRLEGRTAIVTGGAVGIGQHYAHALAAEGAQVMIADIRDGSAVAEEIAAKYGRNSTASIQFDVSDEAQCKNVVAKTLERFGKIDINSTLKDLDTGVLSDDVETSQGDWYDQSKVDETVVALTERISDLGYAFVQVEPVPSKDEVNRTVGIIYQIREGPRVYVERIDIQGNVRTLDEVIRREFRLVEGDAFNSSKLRRTRQRIQRNARKMRPIRASSARRPAVRRRRAR